jgi:hypothetical protein
MYDRYKKGEKMSEREREEREWEEREEEDDDLSDIEEDLYWNMNDKFEGGEGDEDHIKDTIYGRFKYEGYEVPKYEKVAKEVMRVEKILTEKVLEKYN